MKDSAFYNLENIRIIFGLGILTQEDLVSIEYEHAVQHFNFYKAMVKAELESYILSKEEENYTPKDWEEINKIVNEFLELIDSETSKEEVDHLANFAKQVVEATPFKPDY